LLMANPILEARQKGKSFPDEEETKLMARATAERRVLAILVGVIVGLFSICGFAQQISGDLTGTVMDEKGAVVVGATVEALNPNTGQKIQTVTRGSGEYRLTNLPIGLYTVTATAPNFSQSVVNNVSVQLNKINTLNITLKVGGMATTVEVSGVAPQIDTTTAQLSTNYSDIFSGNLGMASLGSGGGVLNLSLLAPNVTNASDMGLGVGPSVGGQRPRNNNFMIEGVDNNNKTVTGALVVVPNDAVAGFTLLENQFNADFGHSSGGQFNTVVKSGTNNFHGSVYEYFMNRNLNAIDAIYARQATPEEAPKNPRYDNNRYGGTFGGPIIKDKLFFFTNFEREPVGLTGSVGAAVLGPTAAGVTTLNATPGLSAINLGVFEKYVPVAPAQSSSCGPTGSGKGSSPCFFTVGGAQIPLGTVPIINPAFTDYENFVQSVDLNLSSKDQIRGRYIYNKIGELDTAANLGAFFASLPLSFHLVNLSEYHTFSPTVTNEFRAGFNRFAENFPVGNQLFPGLDVFPNITLLDLGGGLNIGPDPNAPQFTIQNYYELIDNISWVKGNHNLKFGVQMGKYISPQGFTQRERGDYIYNSTATFLQDLSPDNFGQRSTGSTTYYGDQSAFYWYVNDTYRVNTHLSINAGVRYEYTTIPAGEQRQALNNLASQPNLIIPVVNQPFVLNKLSAQKDLFAPRIGFAYSPGTSGNTSIRAGFGMATDVLYDNIGILAVPPQVGATINCGVQSTPECPSTTAGLLTPNFLANGALPGGGSGIKVLSLNDAINSTGAWIPPHQKVPYSIQWNLGIQHAFGKNYTADIRYLGDRGIHLSFQDIPTQRAIPTPTHSLPTYLQNPGQATLDALPLTLHGLASEDNCLPQFEVSSQAAFCFVTSFLPIGWSNYNGLSGQLTRRFSNGLMFLASYTYSRTIDNSTADFFSTSLTPRRPQDFQNPGADKAVSALNRTHRFTVAAYYDLPYFKNGNWFAKNLFGNWQISPVYTYESPEWFTVQATRDANLNGDSAPDRAIFNPNGVPGTGTDVTPLCLSSLPAGETCGVSTVDSSGNVTFDSTPYVVAYLANHPNAQYIRTGAGAYANVGRNTLAGRPTDNIDLNVTKAVSISERFKFNMGVSINNLFNHPQFIPTNPGTAGQGFGVNDVLSYNTTGATYQSLLTPGNGNFNHPELVFPSNSRTLGLFMKLVF
jgi:Carboxypeptidase regulatory-like domain